MALSIKAADADRLARQLAKMTGETMTEAVTKALEERLERLRRESGANDDMAARVRAFAEKIAARYDRRPVTPEEWDEACGDTPGDRGR
ncbi:MAG: type II toxin-antitoxin system VapB family antitoxin [Parvularculaceae bacterium]